MADLVQRLFAHRLGRRYPVPVQQRTGLHLPGDPHLRARAREGVATRDRLQLRNLGLGPVRLVRRDQRLGRHQSRDRRQARRRDRVRRRRGLHAEAEGLVLRQPARARPLRLGDRQDQRRRQDLNRSAHRHQPADQPALIIRPRWRMPPSLCIWRSVAKAAMSC